MRVTLLVLIMIQEPHRCTRDLQGHVNHHFNGCTDAYRYSIGSGDLLQTILHTVPEQFSAPESSCNQFPPGPDTNQLPNYSGNSGENPRIRVPATQQESMYAFEESIYPLCMRKHTTRWLG